jgi:hypothetical protein
LQQAEQNALRLASLYVTAIPGDAFRVTLEVDGRQRTVDLQAYLGVHNPREPLNTLNQGQRDAIYARLAERVAQWLDPISVGPPRRIGPRFELAITLRARRDHWEHSFSLPHAVDFARLTLDCPTPEMLFRYPSYTIDGEDLFQLLFGSDVCKSGEILGAAFGGIPTADPTRHPLRVRLLTDDERVWTLPWATIAYRGRLWLVMAGRSNCMLPAILVFRNFRRTPAISPVKSCSSALAMARKHARLWLTSTMYSAFFTATGNRLPNPFSSAPIASCVPHYAPARPG